MQLMGCGLGGTVLAVSIRTFTVRTFSVQGVIFLRVAGKPLQQGMFAAASSEYENTQGLYPIWLGLPAGLRTKCR